MVAIKRDEAEEALRWNQPCHGDQPATYVSDILVPQSPEDFLKQFTTIIHKLQEASALIETLRNKYVSISTKPYNRMNISYIWHTNKVNKIR